MSTTDTSAPPSLKALALGDLEHELRISRSLLERVPEAHLDWKPHEKSTPLGGLALHVATIPFWLTRVLSAEFDLDFLHRHRAAWGFFRDRRTDLYEVLGPAKVFGR